MSLIRLQDNVPEPYVTRSRDFQLLLRLYDCLINGVKSDVDSIINITNTSKIRANILPLLQTKLGFFTNHEFNDDVLRYILTVFPRIIRNKGSLKAVEEAVNLFMKISNVRDSVVVRLLEESEIVQGVRVPDHTIVIGLSSSEVENLDILNEVLKYIIPSGFGVYFYFFNALGNANSPMLFNVEDTANVLFISRGINSLIRGAGDLWSDDDYTDDDRLVVNAVDTTSLLGGDDKVSNKFLGVFATTPPSYEEGDYAVIDGVEKYYNGSTWDTITFIGSLDQPFVAWDASVTYEVGDCCIYNSQVFRALVESIGVVPTGSTQTWRLVMESAPAVNSIAFIQDGNYIWNGTSWNSDSEIIYVYNKYVVNI